jgi:hypothetical protein
VTGDYLWDRSGPADADVARLERLLAPLAWQPRAWAAREAAPAAPRRAVAYVATLAATVALVAGLVVYAAWVGRQPVRGLAVARLEGAPTIAARPLRDGQVLSAGHWLVTDRDAKALVEIENVGRIEVRPGTRLGVISTRPGDYRLHLVRGTVQALIFAPPGQFSMKTPSATAVDLGCVYTMSVDDHDVGLVQVIAGWVGFEWRGRESFIPAGAACLTRPRLGPGTPYYEDTSDAFRSAIAAIDLGEGPEARTDAAVDRVLAEARPRDVVTLWHLLTRVAPADHDRVFDRLSEFVAPPPGVTREAVRARDTEALDLWWNALDLGTTSWWRTWKQHWRDDSARR